MKKNILILIFISAFSFLSRGQTLKSDSAIVAGKLVWTKEIPNGKEYGFNRNKKIFKLHKSNAEFDTLNKMLDVAFEIPCSLILHVNDTNEIVKAEFGSALIPGTDTLICLSGNLDCIFFIGIIPDDDVMEMDYKIKTDSICRLHNFHLALYDRWGNVVEETVDLNKNWEPAMKGETNWVLTYEDENGKSFTRHGMLRNYWE